MPGSCAVVPPSSDTFALALTWLQHDPDRWHLSNGHSLVGLSLGAGCVAEMAWTSRGARSGVMLPNSDSVANPRAMLARLVESAERVIKLGKTIIDAGVAVKMVEQKQGDVEREMAYAIMVGIEALGLGENDKGRARCHADLDDSRDGG